MSMRIDIELDEELVVEALRLTGLETKRDVVHEALRRFVEELRSKSLLSLEGKIAFAPGYVYKSHRM